VNQRSHHDSIPGEESVACQIFNDLGEDESVDAHDVDERQRTACQMLSEGDGDDVVCLPSSVLMSSNFKSQERRLSAQSSK
jgi:hypothetical protein